MDNISEIKKQVEAVAEKAREICMKQQETMCLKHNLALGRNPTFIRPKHKIMFKSKRRKFL